MLEIVPTTFSNALPKNAETTIRIPTTINIALTTESKSNPNQTVSVLKMANRNSIIANTIPRLRNVFQNFNSNKNATRTIINVIFYSILSIV